MPNFIWIGQHVAPVGRKTKIIRQLVITIYRQVVLCTNPVGRKSCLRPVSAAIETAITRTFASHQAIWSINRCWVCLSTQLNGQLSTPSWACRNRSYCCTRHDYRLQLQYRMTVHRKTIDRYRYPVVFIIGWLQFDVFHCSKCFQPLTFESVNLTCKSRLWNGLRAQ